jgi:hypothetical protein
MTRTPRYLPSIVKWVLRVRGCTWLLSMLWATTGAVVTGYYFYATTPNYASAGLPPVWLTSLMRGTPPREDASHAKEIPTRVQA